MIRLGGAGQLIGTYPTLDAALTGQARNHPPCTRQRDHTMTRERKCRPGPPGPPCYCLLLAAGGAWPQTSALARSAHCRSRRCGLLVRCCLPPVLTHVPEPRRCCPLVCRCGLLVSQRRPAERLRAKHGRLLRGSLRRGPSGRNRRQHCRRPGRDPASPPYMSWSAWPRAAPAGSAAPAGTT